MMAPDIFTPTCDGCGKSGSTVTYVDQLGRQFKVCSDSNRPYYSVVRIGNIYCIEAYFVKMKGKGK